MATSKRVSKVLNVLHDGSSPIHGEPIMSSGFHSTANKPQYSFIVLILSKEGQRLCTGSLISKNQVLTAASCLGDRVGENLKVSVAYEHQRLHVFFDVLSKITYGDFVNEYQAESNAFYQEIPDIAILNLDTQDTGQEPIPISYDQNMPTVGDKVIFAGWGPSKASQSPPVAHYGEMRVLKRQDCYEKAATFAPNYRKFTWANKLFCLYTTFSIRITDVDFGGPVLFGSLGLVGLALRPRPISEPIRFMKNQPVLVLRLSSYKNYIQKYLHS
ncbi:hypothetical protein QAD02_011591 [Eretmocerus hayati]|uniref:Uncharacterized protein n=1 Tax=Eretmocerus hayati TaxID=131215 RepID=A0ACC2NWV2_9HYME|nr:hypothetical protein QAD02_011591 [Eretmocerus hayati]